uniref:caspase family protein n=1 Tax=uncultured Phenylobacterium sp. TaxID=349273 RepID=UPI0025F358CB
MKRLTALIIGNGGYPGAGALKNPTNDATDLAASLQARGFAVTAVTDAKGAEMDKALKAFHAASKDGDIALFFFAGHGVQIDGENYLLATDSQTDDEDDAKYSSLALNKVISSMDKAKTTTNIIILDACRNNPWERGWRGGARGMASVYAPKGTLIAFSTSPGQTASDGTGRNGAYTDALLKHIETPDVTIEAMFKRVRNTLSANTGGKQVSWEHTSLSGEFFFNLSVASRITDYGGSAIKDKTFVLDESDPAHVSIKGLKSHNWNAQNPVFTTLDAAMMNRASADSLFVLGRNILQAADGCSNSAGFFIQNFMNRMAGVADEKRKAVLDGMLFEIFLNAQ